MKVRNGFVSNSSSSSFLIYGIEIEEEKLLKILRKKLGKKEPKPQSERVAGEYPDEDDNMSVYDMLEQILPIGDRTRLLEYNYPEGVGYFYIGGSWDKVGDNETGKQFKARVEKELRDKIIGETKIKFATYEYAWRDG